MQCAYLRIFLAYFVYIFSYLTNTACIYLKHIFTYNCIFFAYLCIYLPDPFPLAGLQAVPVPFQQALPQQVHVHSSLLASSCGFTRVWRCPGRPPPGQARSPARPAAAAAPAPPPTHLQPHFSCSCGRTK